MEFGIVSGHTFNSNLPVFGRQGQAILCESEASQSYREMLSQQNRTQENLKGTKLLSQ